MFNDLSDLFRGFEGLAGLHDVTSGRTSFGFGMMINLVMKGPDVHLCRSALDDDNTYQRMIYARNLDFLREIFELSLGSALIKC